MIVAGGLYREECIRPHWSRIFGSGGRAAAAVSLVSPGSGLVAYACRRWLSDIRHSMGAFGVETELQEIEADIAFHYLHPLSVPELSDCPPPSHPPLSARGDVVLRFGFVEGSARIEARRAVYDPQNANEVLRFHENGSTTDRLAIVLNDSELESSTGYNGEAGARALMSRCGAEVVVVKGGPFGALVVDAAGTSKVPAYASQSVFKIGSGDVFSAVFCHLWGERELTAADAADAASRSVARYVESRNVQVRSVDLLADSGRPLSPTPQPIYLAGPFFTLAQRWLVEEARDCLHKLGARTFSPIHEVGSHGDAGVIADLDLRGLESCRAVLALIDGEDAGTLFEIGYARKLRIPVVALAESPRPESLTMLLGTGCQVTSD
uniref:PfkB family carbohydrate kinase n=1 Tax=Azorhizobium caulinodans TaxID=7 RepID=UPI002FBDA183